jgi:hypothetical protein
MPSGGPVIPGLGGQTGDQRVNEALFYRSRNLGVSQNFGPGLGEAAGLRMQAPQPCCVARGGAQDPRGRRLTERLSSKSTTISVEVRWSQSQQAPGARICRASPMFRWSLRWCL